MPEINEIYICRWCGYRYDPEDGDPEHNIPPNTPFADLLVRSPRSYGQASLPTDWRCPRCGARKEDFFIIPI